MHLASAVGCPCVTLTSSIEYPGCWEPWNSREYSIRHFVNCAPCFSYEKCPIETQDCIKSIGLNEVLQMVHVVLDRNFREDSTI